MFALFACSGDQTPSPSEPTDASSSEATMEESISGSTESTDDTSEATVDEGGDGEGESGDGDGDTGDGDGDIDCATEFLACKAQWFEDNPEPADCDDPSGCDLVCVWLRHAESDVYCSDVLPDCVHHSFADEYFCFAACYQSGAVECDPKADASKCFDAC